MTKVFCIGLSRTGTTSLATALSSLGWSPMHHTISDSFLEPLYAGDYRLLDSIKRGVSAWADTPIAFYFRELFHAHPKSAFIYTTRPLEAWLRSMEVLLDPRRLKRDPVFSNLWRRVFEIGRAHV